MSVMSFTALKNTVFVYRSSGGMVDPPMRLGTQTAARKLLRQVRNFFPLVKLHLFLFFASLCEKYDKKGARGTLKFAHFFYNIFKTHMKFSA